LKKKAIFLFICMTAISGFSFANTPELSGAALYERKCSRCHAAYKPTKYSAEEWKTIVKEMGPLAGLTKESEKEILDYLSESSTKKDKGLPTNPVLGGYLYTEYFSSKDSVDTFDVHYLNINLSGRLHARVTYRAEFELEHGGGGDEPPFVEQAYLDVWFSRNFALRIGAMVTPFNRFDDFHDPIGNFLVTRPQMAREITNSAWKEVGLCLHGNLPAGKNLYFNYDFYVLNGLGSGSRLRSSRQYRDNNDAKSFGFRLSGVAMDSVEAGVSFYRGAWDDEGEFDVSIYGAHLLAKFGGLNLHAEYARATSENPGAFPAIVGVPGDGKADGYFVQASYLIDKKFRPIVRYGTLDYLDNGSLLGRSPTNYDSRVLAFGLSYYLTPSIVFKLEYDIVKEGERKTDKDNNLLALQAAVRF